MITKEQKQKIIYDLLAKNLPLDLLVEIKDHMEEQLEHKIDFENKSFEVAYEEVKKSWEKDLRMVYAFRLPRKKITILHKKINHKTEKEILLKSLKYFLPFLAITLLLSLYSKELTKGELEMTEGALYPLLHKLENEGVIYSEMQQVNGRDRKYYLLTEKGKKQQALQEEEMKSYLFNLNAIFNI